MIDTDKYEGHTPAPWKAIGNGVIEAHYSIAQVLPFVSPKAFDATANLIADAPLLLEEVERLRDELDKQMGYIEWLEEYAPKAGEYNTSWEAYELAKESEEE